MINYFDNGYLWYLHPFMVFKQARLTSGTNLTNDSFVLREILDWVQLVTRLFIEIGKHDPLRTNPLHSLSLPTSQIIFYQSHLCSGFLNSFMVCAAVSPTTYLNRYFWQVFITFLKCYPDKCREQDVHGSNFLSFLQSEIIKSYTDMPWSLPPPPSSQVKDSSKLKENKQNWTT